MLRASAFMQNLLSPHPVGERIRRHGEIRTAAGDGRVGWIDAHDIAAAAFALLRPGAEDGDQRDYLLTGPKALSYGDAAAIIAARSGRPVRVQPIGTDEQAAHYRASGVSDEFAASLAAVEDGIRAGRDDQVSTAVLDLTGRPPRALEEFARIHAVEWSAA